MSPGTGLEKHSGGGPQPQLHKEDKRHYFKADFRRQRQKSSAGQLSFLTAAPACFVLSQVSQGISSQGHPWC